MDSEEDDPLSRAVIGAAIEVHRHLGPGLLESIYHRALQVELDLRGIPYCSSVQLPLTYKGTPLGDDMEMDVVVDGRLILELKAVQEIAPIHEAQLLSYLGLSGIRLGLLINFNVRFLKDGVRRRVLG
jgi:GxxExxY protein